MTIPAANTPLPKILDIRRTTRSGFSVLASDSDKPLLFIACYETKDTPDIIIRDEANTRLDAHDPFVAQARLSPKGHENDLKIFVGEGKAVHEWDCDVVRHSTEKKGLFRSSVDYFRLDCTDTAATPEAKSGKLRLVWTSCDNGFELVDEATDAVLATFFNKSTLGSVGMGKTLGRLEWNRTCSRQVALAALVSIMGVVEKKHRTMQQVSRAVAWQAGPGSGPVGNSG